jgi:cobyrinic acid a,c-diamide synthase
VIDGTAMAQTFGALALGLARYQPDLPFAGVLANRVGTLRHAQLLEGSLTEGLRWYGALSRETGIELPSRHLGLVQASELNDLDLRLDAAAEALASSCEVALPPPVNSPRLVWLPNRCWPVCALPWPATKRLPSPMAPAWICCGRWAPSCVLLADPRRNCPRRTASICPAVTRNAPPGAGAKHADADAIRAHHAAGKPLLAECGGMLYLLDSLTDVDGTRAELVGLLPGDAVMQKRLAALALQAVELPEGSCAGTPIIIP